MSVYELQVQGSSKLWSSHRFSFNEHVTVIGEQFQDAQEKTDTLLQEKSLVFYYTDPDPFSIFCDFHNLM